jgi:dsRNA-specific ribonuclease
VVTATGSNLKNAEETAASRLLHILTHPNRWIILID